MPPGATVVSLLRYAVKVCVLDTIGVWRHARQASPFGVSLFRLGHRSAGEPTVVIRQRAVSSDAGTGLEASPLAAARAAGRSAAIVRYRRLA